MYVINCPFLHIQHQKLHEHQQNDIPSDHVQQLEMLPDAAPGSSPAQSPTLEMDIRHVPCVASLDARKLIR